MKFLLSSISVLLILLFAQCSEPTIEQELPLEVSDNIDSSEVIYLRFIEAINSGDSAIVKEAILTHWSDTLLGENNRWLRTDMNYWLAAHREFGPLEYVSHGTDLYQDHDVVWCKGTISKDWVGLQFDLTEDQKIDGTNVLRSCSPSDAKGHEGAMTSSEVSADLKQYFEAMQEANLFSGKVLVARGDEILLEGAYGYSDLAQKTSLSSENKLVIASTTKMFTAVAIAQLVEQGKLDLQSPISAYLPDFPKQVGDKITIAHLLNHTSGLELDDIDGFMPAIRKARSVEEFYQLNLEYLPKLETYEQFETTEAHDYSNENFDVLGKLVEAASGENFYEYLDQHIFAPAGMTQTGPIDMQNLSGDIARNYQINRDGNGTLSEGFRDEVVHSDLSFSRPAGSFYSTPSDLYAFLKALNTGVLISDATRSEFTSRKVENLNLPIYQSWYGYGFYENERYGNLNFGHAGGIPGGSSRCEYYPAQDVYVIVSSNYNGAANLAANYISSLLSTLAKE